jgi:hypothetical protein
MWSFNEGALLVYAYSMNIMMEYEMSLHDACMKEVRHKILVIICEVNKPVGGSRYRLEKILKWILKK